MCVRQPAWLQGIIDSPVGSASRRVGFSGWPLGCARLATAAAAFLTLEAQGKYPGARWGSRSISDTS